ncbi:MAG: DUF2905 domain-containing protein [Nitrospirae bacterium]|nr:DUF2905 domain-containing protein [Nitrospirota bacterium]
MSFLGKSLIFLGAVLILIGTLFLLGNKLSWIGKLPGDIHIQKKNFTLYFPLTTGVLLSLVLSLIFWLFARKF